MAKEIPALLIEARRHLKVSQGNLGIMLGASVRTGQRWERSGSRPSTPQFHALAGLVHPHAPDLAAQIAAAGGTTLEQLGLVAPRAEAKPAPVEPPPDPVHLVDTIVCAASEAMQLMPEVIRPGLLAAFRRARLAGLDVQTIERGLAPAAQPSKKATRPTTA